MSRTSAFGVPLCRRDALISASALAASFTFPLGNARAAGPATHDVPEGEHTMGFVATDDDVQIFYKDWGPKDAQPIVFHHGWPLSSDDWDAQMLFFLSKGYRVVAHDRRSHGRSEQVADGHDIDHYAADAWHQGLLGNRPDRTAR
jgi:non-heme chloroperoxidase